MNAPFAERDEPDFAVHAYLDGELDADERAAFERRMAQDPALARDVEAFAADKAALARLFAPVAERALPPEWTAQVGRHALAELGVGAGRERVGARRRVASGWMALAACLLLAAGGWWYRMGPSGDTILADAGAARAGSIAPTLRLAGAMLPAKAERDRLLHDTLHLNVRAPDLSRLGYTLVELDTYGGGGKPAAGLRYTRSGAEGDPARALTIYVRASSGEARFDLLRHGDLRVCIWQDDVVGAVMTGSMSAGEMMRLASAAYSELDL